MTRLSELERAIAQLDCHKHWTLRTRNRAGDRSGYECVIWGLDRRVTGNGPTPLLAIRKAIDNLMNPKPRKRPGQPARPQFRIVG